MHSKHSHLDSMSSPASATTPLSAAAPAVATSTSPLSSSSVRHRRAAMLTELFTHHAHRPPTDSHDTSTSSSSSSSNTNNNSASISHHNHPLLRSLHINTWIRHSTPPPSSTAHLSTDPAVAPRPTSAPPTCDVASPTMAMPAASMFVNGRGPAGAEAPSSPPANRGTGLAHEQRPSLTSPTSPRSSFLGGILRGRARAPSVSNAVAAVRGRVGSPSTERPNPLGDAVGRSVSSPPAGTSSEPVTIPPVDPALKRTHRIRLVPVLESSRSFTFAPVQREMGVMHVPPGVVPTIAAASVTDPGPPVNGRPPPLLLKIGRFTDRSAAAAGALATTAGANAGAAGGADASGGAGGAGHGSASTPFVPPAVAPGGGGGELLSPRAAFKSKVVSRSHAEIWCEPGGKFYIRDTASSSGTFLNHIRLSSPNVNSRPQLLKDGDVLQLGVDYQGGAEEMYRCVKMRVEVGREWQQRGASEFNKKAIKQLTALRGEEAPEKHASPTFKPKKASVTDCCICLFSVAPAQSLFIAPCSHVYHYKCIRPLLMQHHPGFSCPLCRTYANLDEDVEVEDAWDAASRRQSVRSRRNSTGSARVPPPEAGEGADAEPATTAPADTTVNVDAADLPDVLGNLSVNGIAESSEEEPTTNAQERSGLHLDTGALEPASSRASAGTHTPALSGTHTPADEDGPQSHATAAPVSIGAGANADREASTAASLAQTPMNDVFLSTLVITPSQQLDEMPATTPSVSAAGSARSRLTPEIPEEPAEEEAEDSGTGTGAASAVGAGTGGTTPSALPATDSPAPAAPSATAKHETPAGSGGYLPLADND